jgi:hypothetical protein
MKFDANSPQIKQIIACCRNSAVMLEIADGDIPDKEKRERIQKLNRAQAQLLRDGADFLEGK